MRATRVAAPARSEVNRYFVFRTEGLNTPPGVDAVLDNGGQFTVYVPLRDIESVQALVQREISPQR